MNRDTQHRPDIRYLKALTGVVKPEDLNPLEPAAITWAMESASRRLRRRPGRRRARRAGRGAVMTITFTLFGWAGQHPRDRLSTRPLGRQHSPSSTVNQADKPGLGAAHDVWGGIVMRKRLVVAAALAAALALLFAATAHADCGVTIHCTPAGAGRSGGGQFCIKTFNPPCVYTSPVKAPPAESRQP